MRVLVIGGTGAQGRPIVEQLRRKGHQARVLGRHSEWPSWLAAVEAELVQGDIADPQALRVACQGIDALFFLMPITIWPPKSFRYLNNILEAARDAGVGHIVYSSGGAVAKGKSRVAYVDARSEVVHRMRRSDLPITVLEPPVYLDNFKAPFAYPDVRLSGELTWQYESDAKISWITLEDHARHVVAALERPELAGRNIRIAAAEPVDCNRVAELVGDTLQRAIKYRRQTFGRFAARAAPFMGWISVLALGQVFRYHRKHGTELIQVPEARESARLLGLEALSIEDSVAQVFRKAGQAVPAGNLEPFMTRSASPDAIHYRGQLIEIHAKGEQTGNSLCLWTGTCPAGLGPPVHVHMREHEAFYLLEGRLTLGIDEQVYHAGPGDFIFLPAGRPHWFAPAGKAVKMIGLTVPLKEYTDHWDGQMEMFRANGEPAACLDLPPFPEDPRDVDKLVAEAAKLGIEVIEPNPMMRPKRRSLAGSLLEKIVGAP